MIIPRDILMHKVISKFGIDFVVTVSIALRPITSVYQCPMEGLDISLCILPDLNP